MLTSGTRLCFELDLESCEGCAIIQDTHDKVSP